LYNVRHALALAAMALVVAGCKKDDGAGNSPPVIGGLPSEVVLKAGEPLQVKPWADDADGDQLRFEIEKRPGWTSFDAKTGVLSGTPEVGDAGSYEGVRISVTDGQDRAMGPAFRIVVTTAHAPSISGKPAAAVLEGQAYDFTPSASDSDGDALTFKISNKPSWATFSDSTGRLSGTPVPGSAGTYSNIVITVSDGSNEASLPAFTITVQQAAMGSATLSWSPPTLRTDGTPLNDLAGYRILYGTTPGSYSNRVTLSNPGLTSYVVENLVQGTWYFVMTAIDSTGAESDYTAVVSKVIQ
jgi:hypothetical protein